MQPPRFKPVKAPPATLADAESVAATALAFIAEDERRLLRFLSETGLSPGDLRAGAGSRAMLAAVLEHLLGDETLLLTFTANHSLRPDAIAPLHGLLTGAGDQAR